MSGRSVVAGIVLLAMGATLGAAGALLWERNQEPERHDRELPARLLEATVYLPLNDNQGKPFSRKQFQSAIRVLVRQFGGATLGSRHTGFWLAADKRVQSEPVQLLTVSFPRNRLGAFRWAVGEVGRRLGQQSMYVRYEEPRVEQITRQAPRRSGVPRAPPSRTRKPTGAGKKDR
jgi:hypothetical protein